MYPEEKHSLSQPTSLDKLRYPVTDDSTKADILKEFNNNFNHLKDLASSVMNRLSTQPVCCPMELLCTEDQVYVLIMQLDNQKSSGTDNISARILKATITDTTVSTVIKLFNMSIRTGTFPSCWKTARVVPIPQKGCRINPANYRPISILPILSKLLERILQNLIFKHLRSTSPISTRQFGFLPAGLLSLHY